MAHQFLKTQLQHIFKSQQHFGLIQVEKDQRVNSQTIVFRQFLLASLVITSRPSWKQNFLGFTGPTMLFLMGGVRFIGSPPSSFSKCHEYLDTLSSNKFPSLRQKGLNSWSEAKQTQFGSCHRILQLCLQEVVILQPSVAKPSLALWTRAYIKVHYIIEKL